MGLVMQAMDRMEMRRIMNLKETYISISVEEVVRKIGLRGMQEIVRQEDVERVEGLIVRMVRLLPFPDSSLFPLPSSHSSHCSPQSITIPVTIPTCLLSLPSLPYFRNFNLTMF
jgi:hypothetical protein